MKSRLRYFQRFRNDLEGRLKSRRTCILGFACSLHVFSEALLDFDTPVNTTCIIFAMLPMLSVERYL
jgi:hypothetical protein